MHRIAVRTSYVWSLIVWSSNNRVCIHTVIRRRVLAAGHVPPACMNTLHARRIVIHRSYAWTLFVGSSNVCPAYVHRIAIRKSYVCTLIVWSSNNRVCIHPVIHSPNTTGHEEDAPREEYAKDFRQSPTMLSWHNQDRPAKRTKTLAITAGNRVPSVESSFPWRYGHLTPSISCHTTIPVTSTSISPIAIKQILSKRLAYGRRFHRIHSLSIVCIVVCIVCIVFSIVWNIHIQTRSSRKSVVCIVFSIVCIAFCTVCTV